MIDMLFDHFVDKHRGVYFVVSVDGVPTTYELKGAVGKARYHDTELALFMWHYAEPLSAKAMHSTYPGEAISGGSMAQTTPEARWRRAFEGPQYRPRW